MRPLKVVSYCLVILSLFLILSGPAAASWSYGTSWIKAFYDGTNQTSNTEFKDWTGKYNLTMHSYIRTYVDGVGTSIYAYSTGGYADKGSIAPINGTDWTICFWGNIVSEARMFNYGAENPNQLLNTYMRYSDGFRTSTAGGWRYSGVTNNYLNSWTQICLWNSGSIVGVYANGTAQANVSTTAYNLQAGTLSLFAGTGENTGWITQFAMFDRVLTQAQVNDWYSMGRGWNPFNAVVSTNITFSDQNPANLNILNWISGLNINYTFTDGSNWTSKNMSLNYSSNVNRSCIVFINQSCTLSNNANHTYAPNQSISNLNSFVFTENQIAPYTSWLTYAQFQDPQIFWSLNGTNDYLDLLLDNVTNLTPYSYFEIDFNLSTNSSIPVNIYYCGNYSSGLPTSNCYLLASVNNPNSYNHTHGIVHHKIISVPIVNGLIGNIPVSSSSHFLVRGVSGSSVRIYGVAINTSSVRYSANNGNSFVSVPGTATIHLHQFGSSDSLNFFAYGLYGGSNYSSSVIQDVYDAAVLDPTAPHITWPLNGTISNNTLNVTWLNSTPFTGTINSYNVSLYYPNFTFYKVLSSNLGLANNYVLNAWNFQVPRGYYVFGVCVNDSSSRSACSFSEEFYQNYSLPSISVTLLNFTFTEGFGSTFTGYSNVSCRSSLGVNYSMLIYWNNASIFNASVNNATIVNNLTLSFVDGLNYLNVSCSDFLENSSASTSFLIYANQLCLINEKNGTYFGNDCNSSVIYNHNNMSSYNFKVNNKPCVNYSTSNLSMTSLRIDLGYNSGSIINRYVDTSLFTENIKVCANSDPTTHYEQLIISSYIRPIILKNLWADCVIVGDNTRFAYQNAYVLKAYTIPALYYLYTYTGGQQIYFASLDGSIATYINLDTLQFSQNSLNISSTSDVLAMEKSNVTSMLIRYLNIKRDNTLLNIYILRRDTGAIIFNSSSYADVNNVTIYFDYSTLGNVSNTTIFEVYSYALPSGSSRAIYTFGSPGDTPLKSPIGFVVALGLMIFGFTLASARLTFSWLGIVVCLASLGVLGFSSYSWYNLLLGGMDVIVMVYTILLMYLQNPGQVSG